MKNITKSLLMITAVAALAIGGTVAYFSDTETAPGNKITAGTIDIAVDGNNPWTTTSKFTFANVLPGETESASVTVSNVGNNPLVLWKKVKVTAETTGTLNEPECVAEGGIWSGSTCTGSPVAVDNISSVINYDMTVDTTPLINSAWKVKVSDVNDLWIPLGKVAVGQTLTVAQNYHLDEATDNKYQGDEMDYDITFYAEQVDAPGPAHTTRGVVLENKNTSGDWAPIVNDGTWGIITFDPATGVYTAKAWGLSGAMTYNLAYWDGTTETAIPGTASGTSVTLSGTYAGFVSNPAGAKYWLRPTPWSSSSDVNTLYESNLVD